MKTAGLSARRFILMDGQDKPGHDSRR